MAKKGKMTSAEIERNLEMDLTCAIVTLNMVRNEPTLRKAMLKLMVDQHQRVLKAEAEGATLGKDRIVEPQVTEVTP